MLERRGEDVKSRNQLCLIEFKLFFTLHRVSNFFIIS